MKTIFNQFILLSVVFLLSSCNDDDTNVNPDTSFTYSFEQSTEGWGAGFSDYPKDWDKNRLEFEFEYETLPAEVNKAGKALRVSGRNISDDLFLFVKKKLTRLEPNHTYKVSFKIELASKYPEQSVGIGGSPGSSVYLKAGGSTIEPQPIEVDNDIRMNIDKGNQSQGGNNMVVLGNIGIPSSDDKYQLITRNNNQKPIDITTNNDGSLWIIIGTDSGFEGVTNLYYDTIEVDLAY
jgi:hypothetical protein